MNVFGYTIDAPALSLLVGSLITLYVVFAAQRRNNFDWGNALRDDSGKESALRLAIFVSIVVTSWLLIFISMNVIKDGKDLEQLYPFFVTYLAVWSGAKVAEKALDAILAKFGVKPAPPAAAP